VLNIGLTDEKISQKHIFIFYNIIRKMKAGLSGSKPHSSTVSQPKKSLVKNIQAKR
jgi:hypothetical protein